MAEMRKTEFTILIELIPRQATPNDSWTPLPQNNLVCRALSVSAEGRTFIAQLACSIDKVKEIITDNKHWWQVTGKYWMSLKGLWTRMSGVSNCEKRCLACSKSMIWKWRGSQPNCGIESCKKWKLSSCFPPPEWWIILIELLGACEEQCRTEMQPLTWYVRGRYGSGPSRW